MEFLDNRGRELNKYVVEVLKLIGSSDVGFWNHPHVMTFLDIPLGSRFVDNCTVKFDSFLAWDKEFNLARDSLNSAMTSQETRAALLARGSDISSMTKNLKRQVSNIQKRIDSLSTTVLDLQKDPQTGNLQLYYKRAQNYQDFLHFVGKRLSRDRSVLIN